MRTSDMSRTGSYGQQGKPPSLIETIGLKLSAFRIRREVGDLTGKDVGDFGCGFEATFARSILPIVASATLVDLALADDLKADGHVITIEGALPDALAHIADRSLDVVLCTSVLEHLWRPDTALAEFQRVLRPGGVCFVNVPTWLGKPFLELTAFRFGIGAEEMDDHKRYFDRKELWPLLVEAGFLPHNIRCRRHKFGLNLFATCRVAGTPAD
jgi:2-polyprenyl-3-methyl-5-hydroxy-6-metoxy-1,4-benzoquinol methylase